MAQSSETDDESVLERKQFTSAGSTTERVQSPGCPLCGKNLEAADGKRRLLSSHIVDGANSETDDGCDAVGDVNDALSALFGPE